MTYCVGLMVNEGLVFLSDTRTNAGVDNIARYRKMFTWTAPGERALVLMTAGNLATSQAVLSLITEGIEAGAAGVEAGEEALPSILTAPSMFRTAEIIGEAMVMVQKKYRRAFEQMSNGNGGATMILGGQRRGGAPRLFLIYPEGNFIEAAEDTPFLQIGEHKYGKPILDRVITMQTPLAEARKAALLSMDSTLRSNLSVGMPLDLTVLPRDAYAFSEQTRIEPEDAGFRQLSDAWSTALRDAFQTIS